MHVPVAELEPSPVPSSVPPESLDSTGSRLSEACNLPKAPNLLAVEDQLSQGELPAAAMGS